jgi:hypothetical protein
MIAGSNDEDPGIAKTREDGIRIIGGMCATYLKNLPGYLLVPTKIWLAIMYAYPRMPPPRCIREIEKLCPCLVCLDTDVNFWKGSVGQIFKSQSGIVGIMEPYPTTCNRVARVMYLLRSWRNGIPSSRINESGVVNAEDGTLVWWSSTPIAAFEVLERLCVSRKLLLDTGVGVELTAMIKTIKRAIALPCVQEIQNFSFADYASSGGDLLRRCKQLKTCWKSYIEAWKEDCSLLSVSDESSSLNTTKVEKGLYPRALENAVARCVSWKALFGVLEEQTQIRSEDTKRRLLRCVLHGGKVIPNQTKYSNSLRLVMHLGGNRDPRSSTKRRGSTFAGEKI